MTGLVEGAHPLALVSALRSRYGDGLRLSFSRYFYRPQSVFDEREIFQCGVDEIDADWLGRQLAELREGWELALNSSVTNRRGRSLHIPMIDFASASISKREYLLVRALVGPDTAGSLVFFSSGRSFHAYGTTLLEPGGWREFMGRLLLVNPPQGQSIVDTRWVGHRVIAGYSALRWSWNTKQYLAKPRLVSIDLTEPRTELR